MNDGVYAKCACQHCGNHIEFPLATAGVAINCPHCREATVLTAPRAEAAAAFTPEALGAAFGGQVAPTPVSFFYKLGLALVAVMMGVLPLVYLALVVAALWGVFHHGTHLYQLLAGAPGGGRVFGLHVTYHIVAVLAGLLLAVFMLKPIFARRAPRAQPLALNPAAEPVLFAFIAGICSAVGAPMPTRIDLNCELNAAAGFRRGLASLRGNDLVLTIGLPLVAGVDVRGFAGVVAHEFGHFTQGVAMRLSYLVRYISAWFARLVYEPDAWDVALEQWMEEGEDGNVVLVAWFLRAGVGFSRLVLRVFVFLGNLVSCFLSRQMEYDADSCEIRLVGSRTFEATVRRMHALSRALQRAHEVLKIEWNHKRLLPDNLPAFLLQQDARLPLSLRAKLDDTIGLARTGLLDTHPSDGDRIGRARQANEAGIFQLDGPATALFSNFDVVARQVTFLHYTDDLRLEVVPGALLPVAPA